jgi:hypothetical protein
VGLIGQDSTCLLEAVHGVCGDGVPRLEFQDSAIEGLSRPRVALLEEALREPVARQGVVGLRLDPPPVDLLGLSTPVRRPGEEVGLQMQISYGRVVVQRIYPSAPLRPGGPLGGQQPAGLRLERRIRSLGDDVAADPFLIRDGRGDQPRAQNKATVVLRTVLRAAGLRTAGVNPMSIPAWAGAKVLAEGAAIEVVAKLLGLRSLDAAAVAVGFDWRGPR